jgi:glycosyltransferase involved in cell wall biosynthesis
MKIAIYSPYLDTAGGGEKYILTIAEILSKQSEVDVLLDAHLEELGIEGIKKRVEKLHNLDLSRVKFIKAPLGRGSNFKDKFSFLSSYDLVYYNTDGSIFYSTAKKSIIHFQVPFEHKKSSNIWEKIKLASWNFAIYNSKFTKDIVEKSWKIHGLIVYPPVSLELFKPFKKKKQIVSVGRLVGNGSKKQDILIEAFKKLSLEGWSLHLAGGAQEGDKSYISELKRKSDGLDVFFYENINIVDLTKLYGESSIYWHAAGFGETDPKKMEHFGITTVEAMASGCIPIVVNLGGQREIVENGKSGYLWDDIEQLIQMTKEVIAESSSNKKITGKLSQNAIERSKLFSKDKFEETIKKITYGDY